MRLFATTKATFTAQPARYMKSVPTSMPTIASPSPMAERFTESTPRKKLSFPKD